MSRILIVDDDIASCRTLQLHLETQGHEVATGHSVSEGMKRANDTLPDLLILDIRMPGTSGLDGLPGFKKVFPHLHVIMITAFHDMESTIEAMQKGAEDYIHKPIDIDELDSAITRILASHHGRENLKITDGQSDRSHELTMVGRSRAMKEVFKTIGLVAKSPATVLITGESGTGKELVAQAIHRSCDNPEGPFVAVNCAALVETLLESDMFGHEKGAFTGAVSRQEGKFSLAHGGTIFLDEISEMSPAMQAKLLRVLQYKEYMPLGAKQTQKTDARVIAATNVNLAEKAKNGTFRVDLYYRLQVINIHLPPLRERREDLLDLIQTLLNRINKELKRNVSHFSKEVLGRLEAYDWPGNVRELENVLMKAVALSSSNIITIDLLPQKIQHTKPLSTSLADESQMSHWSLDDMERAHVIRVLNATHWHKGNACEILGISRPRLRRMIKQYGLVPPAGTALDYMD